MTLSIYKLSFYYKLNKLTYYLNLYMCVMINQISDFKEINNIERNKYMNVISIFSIILLMCLDK